MDLAVHVYQLTKAFPPEERYGLSSQIQRAAISVPANIAEGQVRLTVKDFANFLSIAKGSLMETETLLTIALRRNYLSEVEAARAFGLITEISKMLTALRTRIGFDRRSS